MKKNKMILSLIGLSLSLPGIVAATQLAHQLQNSATLNGLEAMHENQSATVDSSEDSAAQGSQDFENQARRGRGHGHGRGGRSSGGHRENKKSDSATPGSSSASTPAQPSASAPSAGVGRPEVPAVAKKEEEEEKKTSFGYIMGYAWGVIENPNPLISVLVGAPLLIVSLPIAVGVQVVDTTWDVLKAVGTDLSSFFKSKFGG